MLDDDVSTAVGREIHPWNEMTHLLECGERKDKMTEPTHPESRAVKRR